MNSQMAVADLDIFLNEKTILVYKQKKGGYYQHLFLIFFSFGYIIRIRNAYI